MPNQNLFTGIGHLVRDVEPKITQNSVIVSTCVALNSGYGDYKKTVFLNCVAFGKTAEFFANDNPRKGDLVHVSGELCPNEWEDKNGNKRTDIELKVGIGGMSLLSRKGHLSGERVETTVPIGDLVSGNDEDLPF